MAAKVEFSPDAIGDLEAIGEYIGRDDPGAAVRFLKRLRSRCLSLREFPERGRPYDDRFLTIIEGDYLIFYRVATGDGPVTVIISMIVHGARDYMPLLDQR